MQGWNVLHPMGWDAFGLPAENYAIKTGVHPRITTEKAIANFRRQIDAVGLRLRLGARGQHHRPGLLQVDAVDLPAAVRARAWPTRATVPINWCPSCKTGLANEEVSQGRCERCGTPGRAQGHAPVAAAHHPLRRPPAGGPGRGRLARVDAGHAAQLDRPLRGGGGGVPGRRRRRPAREIRVFTTRPDTLYGATYMVLAPEHPLVAKLTTPEQARGGGRLPGRGARKKSDLERTDLAKDKTGAFTGGYADQPGQRREDPDLDRRLRADRATAPGAIMAVPAHDERDYAFAVKFGLPIRQVVRPTGRQRRSSRVRPSPTRGWPINSGSLDGLPTAEAKKKITAELEAQRPGQGARSATGCATGCSRGSATGASPSPSSTAQAAAARCRCPRRTCRCALPEVERYAPTGHGRVAAGGDRGVGERPPARRCGGPAKRETNTMPQWAGSCWYYLRYLDPKNDQAPWSKEAEKQWMAGRPVRRRRRARGAAPAVRALLAQGALRPGARHAPRSRSRSCATRARCWPTPTRTRMGRYHEFAEVEFRGEEAHPARRPARS